MSNTPDGVEPAEYARWQQEQERKRGQKSAKRDDGMEWQDVLAQFASLPPETDEERAERERKIADYERQGRLSDFRRICPPEFCQKVDSAKLVNPSAFGLVSNWGGAFPGPIAFGGTGTAKTRACWSAIGRLNVNERRSFAWFSVKRLITEFIRYESKDLADEFWRTYRRHDILFVDDADKINWQFESEKSALFQFYDWVYRERRPCLTTTNKPSEWWADKMGDAFTRRIFGDAHFVVKF